jgi:hypothetical protein
MCLMSVAIKQYVNQVKWYHLQKTELSKEVIGIK